MVKADLLAALGIEAVTSPKKPAAPKKLTITATSAPKAKIPAVLVTQLYDGTESNTSIIPLSAFVDFEKFREQAKMNISDREVREPTEDEMAAGITHEDVGNDYTENIIRHFGVLSVSSDEILTVPAEFDIKRVMVVNSRSS